MSNRCRKASTDSVSFPEKISLNFTAASIPCRLSISARRLGLRTGLLESSESFGSSGSLGSLGCPAALGLFVPPIESNEDRFSVFFMNGLSGVDRAPSGLGCCGGLPDSSLVG